MSKIISAQYINHDDGTLWPKDQGGMVDEEIRAYIQSVLDNPQPFHKLTRLEGYREAWSFWSDASRAGQPHMFAILRRSREPKATEEARMAEAMRYDPERQRSTGYAGNN